MGFFSRASPEEKFWKWFAESSARLLHFENDRDRVFKDLARALNRVEAGLTFEFGPVKDGRREFIVSADGIRDRFPAVQRLVAAAPAMPEWTVIPFRPPKSLDMTIEFGGHRLGSEDVWFTAEPSEAGTALTIFLKDLTDSNMQALAGAAFILLDAALGEYAVETQVGGIEWKALPPDPPAAGLKPLRAIREVFDTTVH